MKNFMTTFAAGIILLATTSVSMAEDFLLHDHKNWQVYFVITDDGYEYCSAVVGDDEVALNIDANPNEGVSVWVIETARDWTEEFGVQTMAFIDNNEPWIINHSNTKGSLVWFGIDGPDGTRFLREIAAGSRLYFDYNEEGTDPYEWDLWFSLDGSTAAILALSDCVKKINSPRA